MKNGSGSMIYDTCYIIVDVCIIKELQVLKQVHEIHCICDNLHVHVLIQLQCNMFACTVCKSGAN